ncbi:MAG: hypothetical protein DWP97_08265 [Calditrichaeota bacterium]|nr:MAG: hypothetical protein DWP97_08265 [Calditrichota bacterium]
MQNDIYLYSIYILIAGLLGGLLPFIKKWSDELLHLFLSFGAGIFIGTVFLHLLPEAYAHSDHSSTPLFVLIGFMTIFLIERFLFIKGDGGYDHSHLVVSITAMVGLSVHSIIEGLGLAVGYQFKDIGSLILISILAHKSTAAFALASLFLLAKLSRKKIFLMILLFAAMTPIGAIMFSLSITEINHEALEPLLGLTSGTFLYVAVGELLPEVFHTESNRWFKLVLLILGITIMSFLGHGH